ncbi:xanthine dehydrogenase accessory factor [Actinomycetospora succinea]|uniref:Xanthine dehydrogenase accessory factor n=1 Tax=Actinomycetospora succinea TaxID=663603 RepID=A0A4R6V228_9PSEU|nr:XdhC/CoxI family protein [Actinomycetospora succinea]TDQ53963.1 xanthine dehydrogenase accessory factor [Actinomycetospora succinea]
MSDLAAVAAVLARGDEARAVVRVLDRHGFGTVEPGQLLVAGADGTLGGDLLRGALDDSAAALAQDARTSPATVEAHVAEDAAVAAGLACAGGATLLGHPLDAGPARALADAFRGGIPAALVSRADGSASLAATGGELETAEGTLGGEQLDQAALAHVRGLLRRGATATDRPTLEGADLLVDLWVPVPTITVVGGGAIADALAAQAGVLGWASQRADTVAEADAAVAGFTDADVLVLLDHDPAFDAVLRTGIQGRGFLGALGSRRTQAARRERLLAAGVTEDQLGRIHGPVGLDLGARTPAETAVSIVGEVLAVRSGRDPSALGRAAGPIGA